MSTSATPLFIFPTLPTISRIPVSRRICPRCSNKNSQGQGNPDESAPPSISKNWREVRAHLVAGSVESHEKNKASAYRPGHWAHPLSLPETGCFLASHPAYYRRKMTYLTQAVVFLTHYDRSSGATGLVLNRPLKGTAEELEQSGIFGRSTKISETEFKDQPVYLGGPNIFDKGVLSVIHSDYKVGGTQPLDGVYMCDLNQYLSLNPIKPASEARLFSGCIRWQPGALESEVDDGSWYCVSASEQFALKHCIMLPIPLWKEIMSCQGGLFQQIADRVDKLSKEDENQPNESQ